MSHGQPHRVDEYQPCSVPLRRITWCDATLVVHEGLLPSLRRIEARWRSLGGHSFYLIDPSQTGCYNCRKTTSGTSWSKHAWACAIDINWRENPYGSTLVTNMPPAFRRLFSDEGYGWGGNWSGNKDAMHYSRFPNEGGSGWLYDGDEPIKEEPVGMYEVSCPAGVGSDGKGHRTIFALPAVGAEVKSASITFISEFDGAIIRFAKGTDPNFDVEESLVVGKSPVVRPVKANQRVASVINKGPQAVSALVFFEAR